MSEEKIIKILDNYCKNRKETMKETLVDAIQGLLDLYKQEKEKNKELEKYTIHLTDKQYRDVIDLAQNEIKDKIKEKIKELENKVKDYQCNENVINVHQRYILEELLEE